MISIVPEELDIIKLRIYYEKHTDKHVDIYIQIPLHITDHEECLSKMSTYIDSKIARGDVTALLETAKQFIFENNLKYYEVYSIG